MLFSGATTDQTFGTLTIPATGHAFTTPGAFADSISLAPSEGQQTYSLTMTNRAGYTTNIARTIIRDVTPPSLIVTAPTAAAPATSASTYPVAGSWSDLTPTTVRVDGDSVAAGPSGSFSLSVPLDMGPNGIFIEAKDAAGNRSTIKRFVYRSPNESGARDSSNIAPTALPATEIAAFRQAIQFLWTTIPLVQNGLNTAKLVAGREAVIRGRTIARDFGPVPNVTVSVMDHPEFGYSVTRTDGKFDLAVNGGSTYVLRFNKPEFLEVQRSVDAPILDYALVGDVALIGQSARLLPVATDVFRSVVGRFESDVTGDRQLTMMFEPGTVCSVTPYGANSPTNFSSFQVRLKEYTVGGNGDEAMPGTLPASTAYTYCVDMGLREADSLAGSSAIRPQVTFSHPVVTYVKEFLGLRVGTAMPSGEYDQQRARWNADENGWVVRVAGISNGVATLETDGVPGADAPARLTQLGITQAELSEVARLFSVGDSLWRVRVSHFSPHDFNLNVAQVTNAGTLNMANAGQLANLIDSPSATCGCVIENENRVLGEAIPVSGTSYVLNYRSNRQPGDVSMRRIRIPLIGVSPPPGLRKIRLQVDVAGRRYEQSFTPAEAGSP